VDKKECEAFFGIGRRANSFLSLAGGQIPRPLGRFKPDAPLLAAGALTLSWSRKRESTLGKIIKALIKSVHSHTTFKGMTAPMYIITI